jgi:hypothetical protein
MVNEGLLEIPQKYQKFIISLRTAQAREYSGDNGRASCYALPMHQRPGLNGYNIAD